MVGIGPGLTLRFNSSTGSMHGRAGPAAAVVAAVPWHRGQPAPTGFTCVRRPSVSVLLVENDLSLGELLGFTLEKEGFELVIAYDVSEAGELLDAASPDLLVVDLDIGPPEGLGLLREIRRTSSTPVILLVREDEEDERVRGLELGADDCLTKPFNHRVLVAHIRALFRRLGVDPSEMRPAARVITSGPVTINVPEHQVTYNGELVTLSLTEFRLLHYLVAHAGRIVPTARLVRLVRGPDVESNDAVRVLISRLRLKLHDDPRAPNLLHTVRGVGVMFKPGPRTGDEPVHDDPL